MVSKQFEICRGRGSSWIVTLGNSLYGVYLDREQALLDAVDAARDTMQAGGDAQVWIKDQATAARLLSPGVDSYPAQPQSDTAVARRHRMPARV
jgi:hypothetical protein